MSVEQQRESEARRSSTGGLTAPCGFCSSPVTLQAGEGECRACGAEFELQVRFARTVDAPAAVVDDDKTDTCPNCEAQIDATAALDAGACPECQASIWQLFDARGNGGDR